MDAERGVVIGTPKSELLPHDVVPLHVASFHDAITEVLDLCRETGATFPTTGCDGGALYIADIECWYAVRRVGDGFIVAGVFNDFGAGDEVLAERRAWLAKIEEVFGPAR